MKKNSNKFVSEEQNEIIRFIKVLLVVIVVVVAVYFGTRIFVTKDLLQKDNTEDKVQAGSVDYSVTILGSSLTRREKEYYVMAYDSTSTKASKYATLLSQYVKQKKHEKVYFADLNNHLNKEYYTKDGSNPKATSVSELKVGDLTLFKVKDGKIISYVEDFEKIKEILAVKE